MIFIKEFNTRDIEALLRNYSKIIIADENTIDESKINDTSILFISNASDDMNIKRLKKLYKCYEFSDRLLFITTNPNYGNIYNFISTGLLTSEELTTAILH